MAQGKGHSDCQGWLRVHAGGFFSSRMKRAHYIPLQGETTVISTVWWKLLCIEQYCQVATPSSKYSS